MKIPIKQFMMVFVSICLTGLGISLIVAANIGSDPLTILQQGVSINQSWPLWIAVMVLNVALLVLAYIANRRDFGWATVVDPFGVSLIVLVSNRLVANFNIGQQMWLIRLMVMVVAQVLFSFAYALLIESGGGSHAMDVLLQKLTTSTRLSYSIVRYGFDGLMILIGVILGGTIGAGTVISLLVQGHLVVLSRHAIMRVNLQAR